MYFILNFLGHTLPKLLDLVFEMCLRKRAETKQKYILYSLHKLLWLLYQETAGEKDIWKGITKQETKTAAGCFVLLEQNIKYIIKPSSFSKSMPRYCKIDVVPIQYYSGQKQVSNPVPRLFLSEKR